MTSSSIRVITISLREVTLNERDLQNIALMVNVKTIQLSACELPETAGKVLAELPDLSELDLDRVRLTPQFLADLKNCRLLTKLRLRNAAITPEIVSHLLELKRLEALDLSNSRISDADVARLLTMPSLSEFNLQGTKVTDAAFAQATRAARLSELNVKETAVTHNLVTVLQSHPSLQWFSQDGLSFDPKDCNHYLRGQPMPEARDLNITKGLLAIKPDGGLAESKFLSSLTMTATTRAGELLRIAAKHCAAVETLQLVDEDLSARDLAEIPRSAQYVYFNNCRFSPDAFSELPRVHVRHFRFIDCPPSDVDLTGLSQLPSLRLVMFEGTSAASSEQVVQLSHCRYLRDVRLGTSQVSEEAIRQLADLPSIRSLGVHPASLSPESRARIKQNKPWLELQ